MRWNRFFDDLEDQLASEWEAERASVDSETERLRVSRLSMRERWQSVLQAPGSPRHPSFDLADGTIATGAITAVGADWVALEADQPRPRTTLIPSEAIMGVGMPQADLERSVRPATSAAADLSARMTFGFVLRDLARRRMCVSVHDVRGRALTGTIDRAGSDHLDLALHEPDAPRRSAEVTGHRMIPLAAVAWVGLDAHARL
ncbi:MAG: hypothetical protein ABW024_06175 [Microbacterium sp.]